MAVHERVELRDRMRVFRDRAHAGDVVAEMTGELRGSEATVLAVPAGGLPVARRVAELRGAQPALDLSGRCAVVVDDGLASGFTMGTAVEDEARAIFERFRGAGDEFRR